MKKVITSATTNKIESKTNDFMLSHGFFANFSNHHWISKQKNMCMHTMSNMMNMTCYMSMPIPCKSPSAI